MTTVYVMQGNMAVRVSKVHKEYAIGDVIRLENAFYPLRVIRMDNGGRDDERAVYCEAITNNVFDDSVTGADEWKETSV